MTVRPMAKVAEVALARQASASAATEAALARQGGLTHSLVSVVLNQSATEWLLSSYAPADLSNVRPASPGKVAVDLYQSRAELAELAARYPAEFAGATQLAAEGATQASPRWAVKSSCFSCRPLFFIGET